MRAIDVITLLLVLMLVIFAKQLEKT